MGDRESFKQLDSKLDSAFSNPIDGSMASIAHKMLALTSLIGVLETALLIARNHHYKGEPEPFPGACQEVIRQSLHSVEITRRANLLPPRD